MATQLVRMTVFLKDATGIGATVPHYFNVDDGQTLAQVKAAAVSLGALVDPLVGPRIDQVEPVLIVPHQAGWKALAVAGSTVTRGVDFSFNVTGAMYPWGLNLPGLLASKMTGKHINPLDADIIAYINALANGAFVYPACSNLGGVLGSLSGNFLAVRRRTVAQRQQTLMVGR